MCAFLYVFWGALSGCFHAFKMVGFLLVSLRGTLKRENPSVKEEYSPVDSTDELNRKGSHGAPAWPAALDCNGICQCESALSQVISVNKHWFWLCPTRSLKLYYPVLPVAMAGNQRNLSCST